mgnify:CR=1 FL=1
MVSKLFLMARGSADDVAVLILVVYGVLCAPTSPAPSPALPTLHDPGYTSPVLFGFQVCVHV